MKKIIKAFNYIAFLESEQKKQIETVLSEHGIKIEDAVIKRVSANEQRIDETDEEDGYTSNGYASTRYLDFSADIVDPSGINYDIYKNNPVVFYNHMTKNLPIGKAIDVRRDQTGLKTKIKYAVDENPEASTIYKLVKGGYIRQHSIGFIPLKSVKRGDANWEEVNKEYKAKYEEYKGDANRIITKSLLLEISIVNVADNQSATIQQVKSLLDDNDIKVAIKYGIKDAQKIQEIIELEKIKIVRLPKKEKMNIVKIKSADDIRKAKLIKEYTLRGIVLRKSDIDKL